MQQNPVEILSTNLPLLKREVTLEYMKRNDIPFPIQYIPHIPESKQMTFLGLNCLDAFYGGAAGGMKSDTLLMAGLQYVEVPGYNALLIRDTYANLSKPEGLINRAHDWLHNTDAKWKESEKYWLFPSGATLGFGYLDGPRDHFNYQGPAYQFVGIDEIVNTREHQALYLFSRMRRLMKYKHVPLRFRCAANPPTKEQLIRGRWVKDRYVNPAFEKLKSEKAEAMRDDGASEDEIRHMHELPISVADIEGVDVIVFEPPAVEMRIKEGGSKEGPAKRQRAFVPALMDDNPYLDVEEYEQSLMELDYVTRRQLRGGDWEIRPAGRMVDRSWFEIVDSFPAAAKRVRYWDLAATEKSKDNTEPCWTVGVRMSRTIEGLIFIEHMEDLQGAPGKVERTIRQRADLDATEVGRHPIRMEEEPGASGKANTNNYRSHVLPMYDYKGDKVTGSKDIRFVPFANQAEAGNVYIVRGPWNSRYLDALEALPDAGWDYGDSTSGGYNHLAGIDKVLSRVRVIGSGDAKAHKARQIKEVQDLPEDGMVPVFEGGRCIGYEGEHDEGTAKVLNLLPVYDQGKLVRYDRTARPYGERKRGISR